MLKTDRFKIYSKPRSAQVEYEVLGEYPDHNAALTGAANFVLNNLLDIHQYSDSAKALYDRWLVEGIDLKIEPDEAVPFSAINFVRLIVLQVTRDYSHPLWFEVTCLDQLVFPSGNASQPKEWKFFVKAPATYEGEGVEELLRRATDSVYEDMSRKSRASDGSSYGLISLSARNVNLDDIEEAVSEPGSTLYYVQNDGSFSTSAPSAPKNG